MQVDFNKTAFYKGIDATYGKVPITLGVYLDILDNEYMNLNNEIDASLSCKKIIKMELSVGNDRLYSVNDIARFLDAINNRQTYHFSKNFIFEPERMYFEIADRKLLKFLSNVKKRREYHQINSQMQSQIRSSDINQEAIGYITGVSQHKTNEIIFNEDEVEGLLDQIYSDITSIKFCNQAKQLEKTLRLRFENDISFKIKVDKDGLINLMYVDYSEYGDFWPLSINFRYVYFEHRGIVRLPDVKQDFIMNLYQFKNDENIVCFKISANEMRLFQKNFLEPYRDKLEILVDKKIEEEIKSNHLIAKVYVDIAPQGIISKIEFCYNDKIYNPLTSASTDKHLREIDKENKVLNKLKSYGFKEYERLFLLDDVEKIMFLLTDRLTELKKMAEVYYSIDFKKLHVRNLDNCSISLSEDGSLIHMDINLENITDEELAELLEAVKRGKKYYRLRSGSIINLESVESSKLASLLGNLDIDENGINEGIFEIPLNRLMYIDQYLKDKSTDDEGITNNVKFDTKLDYLINKITNADTSSNEAKLYLPDNLKEVLRSYQLTGVKWLQTMADYSFGGLLADDMGLGKTLQVLAFIASEKHKRDKDVPDNSLYDFASKIPTVEDISELKSTNNYQTIPNYTKLPCIVITPASVVYNWKAESEKFTPELKVLVISGSKDKRTQLICGCKDYDLLITSYGMLKNDIEDYQKVRFLYIFLDEAQNIKNPMTINANSVKSLKARCAFALTGTPVENRLLELWSIFDFIMPGLLFDRVKFMRTYEEPIIKEKNLKKMDELSSIIKPFLLRRMKKDVLSELPDKIETNYLVEMKEEQKKLYAAFYKDFKNELIPKINEFGISNNHIAVLSALTRLRQICAHPSTFLDGYYGGSGKLDLAMELIQNFISTGHSVLLFSQFTQMLKIIRDELERCNINYYYLDGAMKQEDRMIETDNFNHDKESVFLISLKAGGTGLTLTRADVVIHFDPWWNPAVENQASDRTHRIGQKNVVHVYNLMTEGTIEEMVARLKERKKDLFDGVIKPGENFLYHMSEEDIRGLFGQFSYDETK